RAIHDVDGDAPVRCVVGGVVIDAQSVWNGTLRPTTSIHWALLAWTGKRDTSSIRVLKIALAGNSSQSPSVGALAALAVPDGEGGDAGAGAAGVAAGALAVGTVEPAPVVLAGAGAAAAISP